MDVMFFGVGGVFIGLRGSFGLVNGFGLIGRLLWLISIEGK